MAKLEIGIIGAGIGGVMASIAMASAGIKVTVLEAAEELGDIGAGIQMTPNVARLLIKYGVDKAIGDNLVQFQQLNLRNKQGVPVGRTPAGRTEQALGVPWWLVHRFHLHNGLVDVARQNGVELLTRSRVARFEQQPGGKVSAFTEQGKQYTFDLIIGADGVQSVTRRTLFPNVQPRPASANCAFRAIVPLDEVRNDPLTRSLVEDENGNLVKMMDVWQASTGYIISYPISNARDFNMVLSHFCDERVTAVQPVDLSEVRERYKDYDPRIRRVIEMIKPGVSRWPLLITGPLESWSNAEKNMVLMGDAAHSMVNHMAQGAATSMEDGAFLARCLRAVEAGTIHLPDAVTLYEQSRIPKAHYKQQISYMNGWIWQLPDGPAQEARDRAMQSELHDEFPLRSSNLHGDPTVIFGCYGYDAEKHADEQLLAWANGGQPVTDAATAVSRSEADKLANWFLPDEVKFETKTLAKL